VLTGLRRKVDTFAGADNSWTCEGMMRDGKALQMGTSHLLGQNFAKVFDTTFPTETGEREYAWQTSWGVSTRLVGALIMGHGDDAGLRLPPRLAPVQVVVLVVKDEGGAGEKAAALAKQLQTAGVRTELDRRDTTFGRRLPGGGRRGRPRRLRSHLLGWRRRPGGPPQPGRHQRALPAPRRRQCAAGHGRGRPRGRGCTRLLTGAAADRHRRRLHRPSL